LLSIEVTHCLGQILGCFKNSYICFSQLCNIYVSKVAAILYQDRIIARLQQPYSLDCIPVEAEYQVVFS
jgi:HAUS augmin-like complex subunit 2